MNRYFIMSLLGFMVVASALGAERDEEQKRCCLHRLFRKHPGLSKLAATSLVGISVVVYAIHPDPATALHVGALAAASVVVGAAVGDADNARGDEEAPRLRRRRRREDLAADMSTGRHKAS